MDGHKGDTAYAQTETVLYVFVDGIYSTDISRETSDKYRPVIVAK